MKLILVILSMFLMVGCSVLQPNKSKAQVNIKKLDLVSQLAYTTDIFLVKSNVPAAIDSNNKVISIVGTPSMVQMESAKNSISTTNFHDIDKAIVSVQKEDNKVDIQIAKEASKVPALQEELGEYKKFFGLGGIFKSIKRFSFYLILGSILFLVVRILSSTNPIAAALLSVLEGAVGWFLHGVRVITPKAFESVYTASQSALIKVVDTIESNPELHSIKDTLSGKMSDPEKAVIKSIKKKLLYEP